MSADRQALRCAGAPVVILDDVAANAARLHSNAEARERVIPYDDVLLGGRHPLDNCLTEPHRRPFSAADPIRTAKTWLRVLGAALNLKIIIGPSPERTRGSGAPCFEGDATRTLRMSVRPIPPSPEDDNSWGILGSTIATGVPLSNYVARSPTPGSWLRAPRRSEKRAWSSTSLLNGRYGIAAATDRSGRSGSGRSR